MSLNFSSTHINANKQIRANNLSGGTGIPNVVKAKFDELKEPKNFLQDKPIMCEACGAILTSISQLSIPNRNNTGQRTWLCEFCRLENRVTISNEQIPNGEVTYLINPPNPQHKYDTANTNYVVLCIDISGTMGISNEIDGSNLNLVIDRIRVNRQRQIDAYVVAKPGWIAPPIDENRHYISRMEGVQVAIDQCLNNIETHNPEKRVGLVAFNQDVHVIGDARMPKTQFDGDLINSLDEAKKLTNEFRAPEFDCIGRNGGMLRQEVLKLEEGGGTALGPALLYSVNIASQKIGGQVLLCTDGLANVGVGKLDGEISEESRKFYEFIISLAITNGVKISVISIADTNCKLGILGNVANQTSGTVKSVNLMRLMEEFSLVIEENLVATKVKTTLILPRELYIKNHDNVNDRPSKIIKEIGNVTEETEISFQFAVREEFPNDWENVKTLPVQFQFEYTALDGSRQMRVITVKEKVSVNEELVERNVDQTILASHVIRAQSELIQKGLKSKEVETIAKNINKMQSSNVNFSSESYNRAQNDLKGMASKYVSELENDDGKRAAASAPMNSKNDFQNADDETASSLYSYKRANTKNFNSKNCQN